MSQGQRKACLRGVCALVIAAAARLGGVSEQGYQQKHVF